MNDEKSDLNTSKLVVSLNNTVQLEYDRSKRLPDHQHAFLQRMHDKMSDGITLCNRYEAVPTAQQKAQFVALTLMDAIKSGDEPKAAAACSYLAIMLPDLKQVVAYEVDGGFSIDLVFDKAYSPQVNVNFQAVPTSRNDH